MHLQLPLSISLPLSPFSLPREPVLIRVIYSSPFPRVLSLGMTAVPRLALLLVFLSSESCHLRPQVKRKQTLHYGTKPGHFETSKIHFPTSEGVSEVSERANERTDERVAQYLRLYSRLFQTTVDCPVELS